MKLKAYLSPVAALALAVGYAVGWGAFIMPGTMFLPGAGPLGATIGVLVGTVAMSVFALNYHRMTLRNPGPGGALSFTREAFGSDHGFLLGWFLCLTYIAVLWANATAIILLVRFTLGDMLQFGFHYSVAGFDVHFGETLISMLAIVVAGAFCLAGRRCAAWLQTLFAAVLVGGVFSFFIAALLRHEGGFASMCPAFSSLGKSVPPHMQVVRIIAMMPWAFIGFEAMTNSSGEFKFKVKRTFAILMASIVISAALYLALAILPVLVLPDGYATWVDYIRDLPNLGGIRSVPVFAAVQKMFGTTGIAFACAAILAGIFTGMIATFVSLSRLMLAMSEEGILPKWFGEVRDDGTPRNAMLFIGAVSLAIPFFGRSLTSWIVDVASMGAAIAYGYTSAAAFKADNDAKTWKLLPGKAAGFIGVAAAVAICLLYIVPNYFSGETFTAESYFILAMWSILGFIYYMRVYAKDSVNRFGKSSVVWVSFVVVIIFSSQMWERQADFNATNAMVRKMLSGGIRQDSLNKQMDELNEDMLCKSFVEMLMLIGTLYIMLCTTKILRNRERLMTIAKTKAEEINKTKSFFFSAVSHDIRTPLNAIIGFAQLLKSGFSAKEDQEQAVDAIMVSGNTLLNLINDILDLSKLESGKMEIVPEPTDCKLLLTEIACSFRVAAQKASIEIRPKIGEMPRLMLDPQRIRQIAFNLMGNAVKFTKDGFVEVRASFVADKTGESGTFRLDVEDSGCGISEEDLKRIATPYVQVGDSSARAGGTGLGLAISRQLAEAMGGGMSVSSVLGKGTTFSITVPGVKIAPAVEAPSAAVTSAPAAASKPEGHSPVRRVLVVDDQKMNQMVLKALLNKVGRFDITISGNGCEALDELEKAGKNGFDMVLTDMWMPKMDGECLVRAIRADPRFAAIPTYAITADVEMQKHYAEHGFSGILLKPVTLDKLASLVG